MYSAGAMAQACDGPRAQSGGICDERAICVTRDPEDEETPGAATPGGPRDIPVGMDGSSMRRMIRMVKQ